MSEEPEDTPSGGGCMELAEYMSNKRQKGAFCASNVDYDFDDPILQMLGDTPLVQYPGNSDVWCKLERESPTRSHKDRLALGMILELRERGELEPGERVVEASSGNMAGGVALAANRLGHPCTIVSPETASPIKMGFVKSLGAELIQVPKVSHESSDYYQNQARRYAEEHDAVYINQYERSLNRQVHESWTGPELWDQIQNRGVTHIVAATGSGGTLSGIGRHIKKHDDTIETVGVDAEHSNISRDFYGEDRTEYDTDIEGLGQYRTTEAIDLDAIDTIISVSDEATINRTKIASEKHGMLVGTSSGAVLEVAEQISAAKEDACIVTIVHDGAEQYFHQVDGW